MSENKRIGIASFDSGRGNTMKIIFPKVEEDCLSKYYRFNPKSYKGSKYSKYLNKFYKDRESWNAICPKIEEGRSFESYLKIDGLNTQEEKDVFAINKLNNDFFGIAIHHSGNGGLNTMKKIQNDHINGDNQRADISYHFGVSLSGEVLEGRPIGIKGAHLTKYNTGIIGIVFLADFKHDWWDVDDDMSKEALQSIITLIKALKEQFPNIGTLGGHKEWKNNTDRTCPGEYGLDYIKALRKELKLKSPKETGNG
ncbi:N-acetylmuramoyl-L-alanine amidase [Tenacibaculum finnmarkense genomovar finnmarkense]|uniref:N-acetylmuramoyl-L-alanine amidase domain-containing protein n=3 Tax=Tenacibaculum finnmarkense TaxID=2781243 RepID=A0AAP1RHZ2_9FLAO|nr:peptidoglycan recognition family protein [Tenacibaculum finnmarkense]MBE7653985.1 hypothetical protein [Tenacibaculum finnmarkense genomovar finnmarkense]MBE7696283.1 hypothetical protein [Tenacibaculum finnmarkense genomovar finnmarkense]MCD8418793.1 peptidoglycan recognition protein family protein [Tenacibaculum finnmarkense genomovar finnmarkense]MCD8428528.1 peptidoglycan recognition protein family protein [Tenacibaculum finnmarkense genomovar finnmarkense]MCG8187091.1 N-acetylmuramoyl-